MYISLHYTHSSKQLHVLVDSLPLGWYTEFAMKTETLHKVIRYVHVGLTIQLQVLPCETHT
jgi:hypothetical protein